MLWLYLGATIIVVIVVCFVVGFRKIPRVFLLPDGDESLGKKGMHTGVAAVLFSAYHYGIMMPVAIGIVAVLNFRGLSYEMIFVIMWALNALNGWIVTIKVNDWSKKDPTLLEGMRRVVDAVTNKSRISGIFLEAYWLIRLVIWDGPGELIIFLRPRIGKHKMLAMIIFLIAAGLQMLLWTIVYIKGYDSLSQLF
jgi:hypothetical protein